MSSEAYNLPNSVLTVLVIGTIRPPQCSLLTLHSVWKDLFSFGEEFQLVGNESDDSLTDFDFF